MSEEDKEQKQEEGGQEQVHWDPPNLLALSSEETSESNHFSAFLTAGQEMCPLENKILIIVAANMPDTTIQSRRFYY